jgi:hypothetical protein
MALHCIVLERKNDSQLYTDPLFFEKFLCNSSLSGLSRTDNKTHLPPEISGKGDFADMSFNYHLNNLYCFKGKIKAFFDNTLNLPWQI